MYGESLRMMILIEAFFSWVKFHNYSNLNTIDTNWFSRKIGHLHFLSNNTIVQCHGVCLETRLSDHQSSQSYSKSDDFSRLGQKTILELNKTGAVEHVIVLSL